LRRSGVGQEEGGRDGRWESGHSYSAPSTKIMIKGKGGAVGKFPFWKIDVWKKCEVNKKTAMKKDKNRLDWSFLAQSLKEEEVLSTSCCRGKRKSGKARQGQVPRPRSERKKVEKKLQSICCARGGPS